MTAGARRVSFGLGLVLALGLAANGLLGGASQLKSIQTPGQRAQTYAQLAYGVFGVLLPLAFVAARRWARLVAAVWTIVVTAAGGLAPVVWGGASVAIGVVSGAASAVLALGIAWLVSAGVARTADAVNSDF